MSNNPKAVLPNTSPTFIDDGAPENERDTFSQWRGDYLTQVHSDEDHFLKAQKAAETASLEAMPTPDARFEGLPQMKLKYVELPDSQVTDESEISASTDRPPV